MWSFGVVLWELYSFGQVPYAAMSGDEVLQYVVMGHRLGRPSFCPEILYELMLRCWSAMRPSFTSCTEFMLMLAAGVHMTSLPKIELADKNAAVLFDSTTTPVSDPSLSQAEQIFGTRSDQLSVSPHRNYDILPTSKSPAQIQKSVHAYTAEKKAAGSTALASDDKITLKSKFCVAKLTNTTFTFSAGSQPTAVLENDTGVLGEPVLQHTQDMTSEV